MKKLVVAGFSLLSVVLLTLGSQVNVVGYQTVQASQKNLLKEKINQRDLLFQTICDLANNKDIQKNILSSQLNSILFIPSVKTLPIKIPVLTKRQLEYAYRIGSLLSTSIRKSQMQSLDKQNQGWIPVFQKKVSSIVEKDTRLKEEITQLCGLNCHCEKESYDKTTICNFLFIIVIGSLFLSLITMGIFLIFVYIGIYIADNILNCNWFPFYPP
jgi:hypothetical protein